MLSSRNLSVPFKFCRFIFVIEIRHVNNCSYFLRVISFVCSHGIVEFTYVIKTIDCINPKWGILMKIVLVNLFVVKSDL